MAVRVRDHTRENPDDQRLAGLVEELSTHSDVFAQLRARQAVQLRRIGSSGSITRSSATSPWPATAASNTSRCHKHNGPVRMGHAYPE